MKIEYIAGLFDGEGCVQISPEKSYALRIDMSSTYLPVLEKIKAIYGGHLLETSNRKAGYKPCWVWRLVCGEADKFLRSIIPFLIIKKAEAEYAVFFRKKFTKKSGRKVSPEEWAERKAGRAYLRSLR